MSRLALTLIMVAAVSSGCIENMGDLKERLGVREPAPPAPTFSPPLAKAQANATLAPVGSPLRFVGEGSKDPQGLALTYAWDFGDTTKADGPVATHRYASPGEYVVRLTVTNEAGLQDEDVVALRVSPSDAAPTASMRVLDAGGLAVARADMGSPLTFEALASDPEGSVLTYAWSFGDGAESHEARTSHAYTAPGAYAVSLRVTDRAGNVGTAQTRIVVDGGWREKGAFEPAGASTADVAFPLGVGARALTLTLTYPAGFGLNDVEIVVLDAAGAEVGRSQGAGAPGAQGDAKRELEFDAAALATAAPGAWTAQVLREGGMSVEWALEIRERFSLA